MIKIFENIKNRLFGRKYKSETSIIQFNEFDIEYVDDNNFVDVLNNIIQSITNKVYTLDIENESVSNYNNLIKEITEYSTKIDHLYTFATTSFFIYIKDMSSVVIPYIIEMEQVISKHSYMYLTTSSRKDYEVVISCSLTLEDMIYLALRVLNDNRCDNLIIKVIIDSILPIAFDSRLYMYSSIRQIDIESSRSIYYKGQIAPMSNDYNVHIYVLENQLSNIAELEGNVSRLLKYTNEEDTVLSMMQIVLCYDNIKYSVDLLKSNSNTFVSMDRRIICKYNILELYELIDKLISIVKTKDADSEVEELSIIISVLSQIKINTSNIILSSSEEANRANSTIDETLHHPDTSSIEYMLSALKINDDSIDESIDEIL